jgi:transcriptional regulator with XRE-family HTH domain
MPVFFGTNLQFLRRRSGITQETLAQQMGVSRQTVSKWESGEAMPELGKLMDLSDIFSCKLDSLLREDLTVQSYPVRILRVSPFRMARYIMISANAREDVCAWLDNWAKNSALLTPSETSPILISWGFPYVSPEQEKRFGLNGHAAAYILPEHFDPPKGPEIIYQDACNYAVLTMPEPDGRHSHRISQAIHTILDYLRRAGIPKAARDGFLPCFEYRYEKDGIPYVDIFLQCQDCPASAVYTF